MMHRTQSQRLHLHQFEEHIRTTEKVNPYTYFCRPNNVTGTWYLLCMNVLSTQLSTVYAYSSKYAYCIRTKVYMHVSLVLVYYAYSCIRIHFRSMLVCILLTALEIDYLGAKLKPFCTSMHSIRIQCCVLYA